RSFALPTISREARESMQVSDIKKIAVIGAGTMGAGIAQACAAAGFQVTMRDIEQRFVDGGFRRIREPLQKRVERVKIAQEDVEVKESPGFVVNRLLVPMMNEAFNLLQEGVASPEDIDKAMKLGTNMPMGPFELADYTGLDIGLDVMEVLFRETGDPKFRPSTLLRKYVRAGRLGRKSGRGVYSYPGT